MSITIYVSIAALLGLGVLLLVTGELSRKKGPSRPGHIALAAIMGFGVIGLTVKAFALVMLTSPPRLAGAVDASQNFAPQTHSFANLAGVRGITYPKRDKAWQALPRPKNNDSDEMIALGQRLFFDQRLSSTGTVSCASCHDIPKGGDDGQAVSTGINGLKGDRNAPSVLNAVFLKRLFWDGRARSLEEQAVGPLMNPIEMGLSSPQQAVEIVNADPNYVTRFKEVFKGSVTIEGIAQAIAAFERTLITNDSPYDRFVRGDVDALSAQQLRGMYLFDEIGCRRCHQDPVFSVAGDPISGPFRPFPVFQGTELVAKYKLADDQGLNARGVWRVPSLRNVALTAPYFHNGSVTELEEAVRIMATAQLGRPLSSASKANLRIIRDQNNRPTLVAGRALTNQDIRDIAEFLRSLSGTPPILNAPNVYAAKNR